RGPDVVLYGLGPDDERHEVAALELDDRDPRVAVAELEVALALAADHDDGRRPVRAGERDLVADVLDERRVLRAERTALVGAGAAREDDGDLPLHVDAGVVVVAAVLVLDAVAAEDERRRHLAVPRVEERPP